MRPCVGGSQFFLRRMCATRARAGHVSLRASAAKFPALCGARARNVSLRARASGSKLILKGRRECFPTGADSICPALSAACARDEYIPASDTPKVSARYARRAREECAPSRSNTAKIPAYLPHLPRGGAPCANLRNGRPARNPFSLIATHAGNATLYPALNAPHFIFRKGRVLLPLIRLIKI